MILRASSISAQSTVALVKFFVTCVRIRHIIYEILCYSVIYGRGLYNKRDYTLIFRHVAIICIHNKRDYILIFRRYIAININIFLSCIFADIKTKQKCKQVG